MAASLQRNLRNAIPGLISQVQDSRGSVSTAFQLCNDLNAVVESLDSLIASIRAYGRAGESGPLATDYAALSRIRQQMSSYIEVAASSLEPRTKAPGAGAPATLPKKAGSDDNGCPLKPAKKKTQRLATRGSDSGPSRGRRPGAPLGRIEKRATVFNGRQVARALSPSV